MADQTPLSSLVENEAVFRQRNERVKQNFDEIRKLAKETGQEYLVQGDDTALHFYCECSDENCEQRVVIKPSEYNRIHKNRRHFVLLRGHEIETVERIILNTQSYTVVEKKIEPPETKLSLNKTDVDNG